MNKIQKIKAEIERLYSEVKYLSSTQALWEGGAYKKVLDFINSSEEEPVSEDLQKFADEWDESLYRSDAVIAGANWQKEQMMKGVMKGKLSRYLPYIGAVRWEIAIDQQHDVYLDHSGLNDGDEVEIIVI